METIKELLISLANKNGFFGEKLDKLKEELNRIGEKLNE